jgi:hypothetical protein
MSKDDYGFGTARRPAGLDRIKPGGAGLEQQTPVKDIDRAGEAIGFTSRDTSEYDIVPTRRTLGPTTAMNMRAPIAMRNRFVEFCRLEGRLSYWEGIERMMDELGIDPNGRRKR